MTDGTRPIDTIREALKTWVPGLRRGKPLAALTEVEQQLEAGLPILSIDGRYVLTSKWAKEQARAVAAETALAEWQEREGIQHRVAVAAEQRANDHNDRRKAAETGWTCDREDCQGRLAASNRAVSENADMVDEQRERAEAAERRANDLADALRAIADYGHEMDDYVLPPKEARKIARAALDRQEQRDGT